MTPTDAVLKHLDLVDKYAHAYAMGGVHAAWPTRGDVVASAYALVGVDYSPFEVPNTFKMEGESDDDWIDRITGASPTKSPAAPDA
jgi:hypothetical protein